MKNILGLKLSNANIHRYTSHFTEIQQKDNETLVAYVHWFKTEAKRCSFNSDTATIYIFIKSLLGCTQHCSDDLQKGPPDFIGSHQAGQKAQCSTTDYSRPDIF